MEGLLSTGPTPSSLFTRLASTTEVTAEAVDLFSLLSLSQQMLHKSIAANTLMECSEDKQPHFPLKSAKYMPVTQ